MKKRKIDHLPQKPEVLQEPVCTAEEDTADSLGESSAERFYSAKILLFALLLTASCLLLSQVLRRCAANSGNTGAGGQAPHYPITVVLDAGHGGFDGGAVSVTGSLEKDLNLQLALQLRDMLEAAGAEVIMTRTEDRMLTVSSGAERKTSRKMDDLQGRLQILSEHPDAVLVSLHMNKFPQASAHGAQVYYSPNHAQSEELARCVQEAVRDNLQPENKRAVKEAGSNIFLLYRAKNPAILIECGFLSNPEEAEKLDDPQYRQSLACVLCAAILTQLRPAPAA